MSIKVLSGGSFKPGTPKGVLQGGVWKAPKKVWALKGGIWKQVWPAGYVEPEDKVKYIGSQVTSGTTPTSLNRVAGDLMIVVAQSTTSTAPALPSGWTSVHVSPDGDKPLRMAWKIAASSSDSWSSWSGASWVSNYIFRGFKNPNPFGPITTTLTPQTEAFTPQANGGRSQVVYYMFQRNGTSWMSFPPELIGKNSLTSTYNGSKFNSETAPSLTIQSQGATGHRSLVFEVRPAGY
jgi:hypothetical protein